MYKSILLLLLLSLGPCNRSWYGATHLPYLNRSFSLFHFSPFSFLFSHFRIRGPMTNARSTDSPSVITELEECVRVGGAMKSSCNELEKPMAWGCSSSSRYCCCAPRDGKATRHLLGPTLCLPKPKISSSLLLF